MNRELKKYQPYLDFIDDYYKASNAATGSKFDSNANVEQKNVTTATGELYKHDAIGINRLRMYKKITELYGESLAKEYIRQLDKHEIYRHDETSPLTPYCVSVTLYPFLFGGLQTLGGNSGAPHNLDSFAGSFCNLLYMVAAQFAGACSTPEWLSYMDYFIRKEYGNDYYTHVNDVVDLSSRHRTIDKMICDKFEQVVYTLNAPAGARNLQSIFWNIAYFDKPHFEGMFENFVFPDGTPMQWDSVSWLQKRFMRWLNNERTKRVLTFPVETLNLLDDGTDYVDNEWADYAAQMLSEGHSFFIYRSNSVDSLASCCFSGGTVFLTADGKKHKFNDYKDGDEVKVISPITHELCAAHVKQYGPALMQDITFRAGDTVRVVTATPNHEWILLGGKRTNKLKVGDALWGNLYKVESIKPCEGTQMAWCLDVNDDTHAFYLDGAVPTGNCRLRNEMQDNTFSYTLGAGGVATGSKGVITINMNRLIQNCTAAHEDMVKAVREQVQKIHKYLTAFNELLKEEFKAKLLPVYDAGYISLEKQYLTIGINGFVEGCEFLGYDISPDDEGYIEFTNKVLTAIYEENRAARTDELMFNTEYVPRMSGHEAA